MTAQELPDPSWWTSDHDEYLNSFRLWGYSEEFISHCRSELIHFNIDRADDFHGYLETRHTSEYKELVRKRIQELGKQADNNK